MCQKDMCGESGRMWCYGRMDGARLGRKETHLAERREVSAAREAEGEDRHLLHQGELEPAYPPGPVGGERRLVGGVLLVCVVAKPHFRSIDRERTKGDLRRELSGDSTTRIQSLGEGLESRVRRGDEEKEMRKGVEGRCSRLAKRYGVTRGEE